MLIPEIADYEIRREILRAEKIEGLRRLDALVEALEYIPLTTAMMRQAAAFWAETRKQGRPTADDKALDGDVILAAKWSYRYGQRRGDRGDGECRPSHPVCTSVCMVAHSLSGWGVGTSCLTSSLGRYLSMADDTPASS